MTLLVIVITILAGLLLGALGCIIGVFAWRLLVAINALQATAEVMMQSVEPLIKEHSPKQIAEDLHALKILGARIHLNLKEAIPAVENLAKCVTIFNNTIFDSTAVPQPKTSRGARPDRPQAPANLPTRLVTPDTYAKEDESAAFHFDEEDAATREAVDLLRKSGIEVEAANVEEPTSEQMTGAEA